MQGTIVINAQAARALRQRHASVARGDVLWCQGAFRSGDRVYVVVRGDDGGQGVIATGRVACDATALQPFDARAIRTAGTAAGDGDALVVMPAPDIELLWPR